MKDYYDHLYLSPHFDDAVLSCGGQIFRHTAGGDSVLVATVATAEPPDDPISETVEALHRRWADSLGGEAPASLVAQRRAEDVAALAILRADVLHLPFLDCIYRRAGGMALYPGPTDMFGAINPSDTATAEALAAALAELPRAGRMYLPLGVGGHVDHALTRRAGERTWAAVTYYEDYPYTMIPGALDTALPPAEQGNWQAETVWLTDVALAAKVEAVSAYRSQLSSFFAGPGDLAAKLSEDGRRVLASAAAAGEKAPAWAIGGERLWQRRESFTLHSFEQ